MLFNGCDSVVEYSLDPWMQDLVQILLNFLLRKAFIHPTEEVGNRIVFTLLVLQGEVVASEVSYPSLPLRARNSCLFEWYLCSVSFITRLA